MSYAGRVTQTGLRDCTRRVPGYYIRRTCTGEIKDNAKKKIQQRIACGSTWGEGVRESEMNA
ncbi:hypothetical protein X777_16153 [Ooceraea biroi]|uniref:Uncharacterized protein n=1 Tax=Ooceraea biroi TaxID=2015173 RepID=A0A026WV73_OOCBI|nr:hypothetical protein X777_16153 [Ooceraea biroi]